MTRIRHDHTHNADDIYDFDSTPPEPISPGVTQTVSLLGPYPFTWDSDLDLDGSWHTLVELDSGIIVLRAWAIFETDFDVADQFTQISILSGGTHQRQVVLAVYPNPTVSVSINNEWFVREPASFGDADALTGPHGSFGAPVVLTREGALLVASYAQFTPTQGACDIYALIATPAS